MGLQDEILDMLEQITDDEKKVIGEFLKKMYAQHPSKQINLESRAVKTVKCIDQGSWGIVAIANTKIESVKDWLSSEGFTVIAGYTPKGTFWGYKIFLTDKYAPL